MINKTIANAAEAVEDVFSNAVLMFGGFGLSGIPENSIKALLDNFIKFFGRSYQLLKSTRI